MVFNTSECIGWQMSRKMAWVFFEFGGFPNG